MDPNEKIKLLFEYLVPVMAIMMIVLIVIMVFALRSMYLHNKRVVEITRVGNRLRLVRQLKLTTGDFPIGTYGEITAIHEQPIGRRGEIRQVAVVKFGGFLVAMSMLDMKFYFVPETFFRWNLPEASPA